MEQQAEDTPRDQALLEAFEPVSFDGGELRVRVVGDAAASAISTSRASQLGPLVQALVGRNVRVVLEQSSDLARPAARVAPNAVTAPIGRASAPTPGSPASPGSPAAPGSLPAPTATPRALTDAGADEAVRTHPIVRKVAALFDATIVRVESASTLPVRESTPDEDDDETAGEPNV